MQEQHLSIEAGRRVRFHLPYHREVYGLIVDVQGTPGLDRRVGPMTLCNPAGLHFTILDFEGGRHDNVRETAIGRPGIGRVDLLDKVHGPALIAKARQLHADKVAADARAKAEAPHRLAAAQEALVMPATVPLFYWNGIKDAKGEKLQKAWYSGGACTGAPDGTITIYARDYGRFSDLVRACFTVENDSDVMTDYFDKDRIRVTPWHPLFPQVRAALAAQEAHRAKRGAA